MSLYVVDPGLSSRLVDRGRPRTRSLGVPVGGAADLVSMALGNGLVGNPPDAPALEITLRGPILRADTEVGCVVFGAPFDLSSARQPLRPGRTFTLDAGEELHIAGTASGLRAYLCVKGGFRTPLILNSHSALEPVSRGSVLHCEPSQIGHRYLSHDAVPTFSGILRCLPGLQMDWFQASEFFEQEFQASAAMNRMGLRLQGRPLTMPERELVSEPVCPGSVQVTRDGQCIVLGMDGQTIGGYPKVAQVIRADMPWLGQLRPGGRVRFQLVDQKTARHAWRDDQARLNEWLHRLRLSLDRP